MNERKTEKEEGHFHSAMQLNSQVYGESQSRYNPCIAT